MQLPHHTDIAIAADTVSLTNVATERSITVRLASIEDAERLADWIREHQPKPRQESPLLAAARAQIAARRTSGRE